MLSKLQKYGALNTHDSLKFLAISLMLVDHVGLYFFPDEPMFRAVGRACVPIWFFLIGRHKTSRFDYMLVIYALAIEALNFYVGNSGNLDILFTIFITRLLLNLNEKKPLHSQGVFIPIALCLLFYPLTAPLTSYGSLGFMLAYIGYLQRVEVSRQQQLNYAMLASLAFLFIQFWSFGFGMWQMLISSSLTAVMVLLILNYRLVAIGGEVPKIAGNIIQFLGRYSLEFYAFHLLLFILIKM